MLSYLPASRTNSLVAVEQFKAVTILSINRPDKQNAMNEALLHELASHLTHFEEDDSASVVVINGIGGNFSVGYDIDELKQKCEHGMDAVRSSIFVCSFVLMPSDSNPNKQSLSSTVPIST